MPAFLDLTKKRRSIRRFTGQKIERRHLEMCAEAARYSPSACNVHPWKFIIIDDPQKIALIADLGFSGPYSRNAFAREAGAFIACISEKQKLFPRLAGIIRKTDFRLIDIGIACEHVVLQATELNLGTCILGWFNERKLKKLLSVPASKRIELVIALGYPVETDRAERQLKEISEVRTFNKY